MTLLVNENDLYIGPAPSNANNENDFASTLTNIGYCDKISANLFNTNIFLFNLKYHFLI